MTTARRALVVALVALSAGPAAAQVKYPPRPDTVDVQLRYRLRPDRAERVREFRELTAFLDTVGFTRTRQPDDETDLIDPTAERFAGTIPSRNVLELLNDPRVKTVVFKPADLKLPADQAQPVSIRLGLPTGYLPSDQQRLHRQVVAQLGRLGFREAVGYDTARSSLVRGDLPAGNLFRLLNDLRREPAGWFVADTPLADLPAPLRDTLPVRWVEVLPDPPLTPYTPQAVPVNRAKFTPELRGRLDDPAAAGKPVRVEVVYDHRPDAAELDAVRSRLRVVYAGPGGSATLEGAAGNVLTVEFLKPADVEAFAAEPGVVFLRRPVRAVETVAPLNAPDAPTPTKLLSATRLDAFHAKGYRGKGTTIVVIGTDFPGAADLLKDERSATLVDLTAEFSRDLRPAPAPANPSPAGTAAARAARLAAPDARLVLVRVDPAAFTQVFSVARFVTGAERYSEAMQSRLSELAARGEDIARRRAAAVEERRRALEETADDEKAVQRRAEARKVLDAVHAEEKAHEAAVARALALQAAMRSLAAADVVVNTLVWEDGFAHDGLSDLSQLLDTSFASCAVSGPRNRSATRPRATPRPVWVQATSPLAGSVWAGPFLDANGERAMEFAPPGALLPVGEWTPELNFLGTRAADETVTPTLAAGARVRLVVQWREAHDPFGNGGDESIFPLTLRVFRQLDPDGKARASDELVEVARSAGGPYRLWAEPGYAVYEQILEFTAPEAGRYALRIDGGEVYDVRIPALRQRIEITPRVVAEFVGGDGQSRPVWRSHVSPNAGVGIPGDAKAAIAVSASTTPFGDKPAGATGAGPGVVLLAKPDLLANGSIGGDGGGGSGVAAGFAGGVLAGLIGSGAPPADVIAATGLRPGGPAVIPDGWLQVVPTK